MCSTDNEIMSRGDEFKSEVAEGADLILFLSPLRVVFTTFKILLQQVILVSKQELDLGPRDDGG